MIEATDIEDQTASPTRLAAPAGSVTNVQVTLTADKDLPESTANALAEMCRLAAEQLERNGFEDENRWFGPDAPKCDECGRIVMAGEGERGVCYCGAVLPQNTERTNGGPAN